MGQSRLIRLYTRFTSSVHPFYIVGVRHTAFAVCQAFAAEIAILFMGIAGGALAVVRMTGQVHCVGIGRVVVHQFVLAVVVGCAIVAAAASMIVIMVVPMVMSMVVSVVVIMSVVVSVVVSVVMIVVMVVVMVVVVSQPFSVRMSRYMVVVMYVVVIVAMVVVMSVVVVMVVVVVVSQPFSVRMSRYMVVVMYVVVSMLLYDSFYSFSSTASTCCITPLPFAKVRTAASSALLRTSSRSLISFAILIHLSLRLRSGTGEPFFIIPRP